MGIVIAFESIARVVCFASHMGFWFSSGYNIMRDGSVFMLFAQNGYPIVPTIRSPCLYF